MNQQEFVDSIAKYHEQLLKIATDNWYAITLAASISDGSIGTTTIGWTNMSDDDMFRSLAQQTAYFYINNGSNE